MGQLYLITFKTSQKSYVGISSKSAAHRWKRHIDPHNKLPIGRAFQKYGIEDATLIILAETDCKFELCAMEIAAIAEYKSKKPTGYNLTDGGEGVFGLVHSAETRAIMSEKLTKYYESAERRATQAERIAKLSSTPEAKARFSTRMKNYWSDPVARKAKSVSAKQQWTDPTKRASIISAMQKTAQNSSQLKSVRSANAKAQFADPEAKQRNRAAIALGWAKKTGRLFSYIQQV